MGDEIKLWRNWFLFCFLFDVSSHKSCGYCGGGDCVWSFMVLKRSLAVEFLPTKFVHPSPIAAKRCTPDTTCRYRTLQENMLEILKWIKNHGNKNNDRNCLHSTVSWLIHDIGFLWSRRKQFVLWFKQKSQISSKSNSSVELLLLIRFNNSIKYKYDKNDRAF